MGALAPVSQWLPEDDLLLKNAIEAGASLESLAKGAVQFSQKFTVRELQDRWHSLLYDPVISSEASFRMIEFERSAPIFPSKFNRAGNSKENRSVSGKRKAESVRTCYYALRKRICNEPFNSMDLGFLVAPSNGNYVGDVDEPPSGNCILGDPMSNHFGLQESNLDIMHCAFPQMLADGDTGTRDGDTAHAFRTGLQNPVKEEFPMEQDIIHKEIPLTGNGSGVEGLGQPKELPLHSLFEADELTAQCSTFDQMNIDPGNVCSEFEGNQVFNSVIPECRASFQNLEYSSPLPEMPIWGTVEGISAPSIPVDVSLREKDMQTEDTFALPDDDDAKNTSTLGYDVVHEDSKLKLEMPCDEFKSPTASTEGYLAELSNSLLNFSNEEEFYFMDVDGKDVIDKSYYDGLSSLLLNSPNDVNQDCVPSITEPETSVTPGCLANPSGACPGELDDNGGSRCSDGHVVCNSEVQMLSSASTSKSQFPELSNGVIFCVLNTEDPVVPCNDDVVIPNKLRPLSASFIARQSFKGADNPMSSSVKDFSGNGNKSEVGPVLMQRDKKNPGQSHASSKIIGPQVIPETGQLHPVGDCRVKFELPNSPHFASSSVGIACGGSSQINSSNISKDTLLPGTLKEETKEIVVEHFCHESTEYFMEKPVLGSDSHKSYPQRNPSGSKQELDAPAAIQDHQVSNVEVGSLDITALEQMVNPPMAEPEEPLIESDDEVPYFSDIEAMILDMDLDPDDQDLYDQEVSRYQHEETKRAIIRLEQGAHSYMQRAIASHGAFAVLYGRHSKHYIKKPEVLLGRATEDVIVDIDLGREGRANKISRRQAIITLDKVGSFYLKNLGKHSISVNNKEVAPGQSLSLNSSCLIEIRGMPFIFETNQTCVKQYLDNVAKKSQPQEHQV